MEPQGPYEAGGVMKALAHPSRLIIMDALAEGESVLCELQEPWIDDAPVSRHLSQMKTPESLRAARREPDLLQAPRAVCAECLPCIDRVLQSEASAWRRRWRYRGLALV